MLLNKTTNELIFPILPDNVRILKRMGRDVAGITIEAALFVHATQRGEIYVFWLINPFCVTTKAENLGEEAWGYSGAADEKIRRGEMQNWTLIAPGKLGILMSVPSSTISLEESAKCFGIINNVEYPHNTIYNPCVSNQFMSGETCTGEMESIYNPRNVDQIITGIPNNDICNGDMEVVAKRQNQTLIASEIKTRDGYELSKFNNQLCKILEKCSLSLGW